MILNIYLNTFVAKRTYAYTWVTMKKFKVTDHIVYFAPISILCFVVFAWQYKNSSNEYPRSGSLLFVVGCLSLTIFLVGKNISRMAKKGYSGRDVTLANVILALIFLSSAVLATFLLFFCLTF
jgi:hypothetical protein